jgi:hypothetical protein
MVRENHFFYFPNMDIVATSSYVVFDGQAKATDSISRTPDGCPGSSKYATFYTFDGQGLCTIPHNFLFPSILARLDLTAPKPQPSSFKRIWWPAIRLGFGMTKGSAGYAVYFHDKNGHRIGWTRMTTPDEDSSNWSKWDLSHAVEEPSDFSEITQEI